MGTLVLSFDPGKNSGGRKSGSGWCLQDETKVYDFGVIQDMNQKLSELLWKMSTGQMLKPDVVVYEGYGINPNNVSYNVGSDLTTVQNIGAIKLFANLVGSKTHIYRPDQKKKQWAATGKNPTKVPKAQSHWIDAFNHGRFYLIERGLAPSLLEEKIANGEF